MTATTSRIATRTLVVDTVENLAEDVLGLTLRPDDGFPLAPWAPGAHIDVTLPSGITRQYSLCSDPADPSGYRIAVRLDRGGRGGSLELHSVAEAGLTLEVSDPRNTFPLVDADSYLLIAGGIGITALLAMARELDVRKRPCHLLYVGTSRERMPLLDEVSALQSVSVVETAVSGRPVLTNFLATHPANAVFVCGPAELLDATLAACTSLTPACSVHVERFSSDLGGGESFTVELARSGVTIDVAPDQSVLEALRYAGVDVESSCEMGICGTCETRVLSGEIEHRDDILTDAERAAGDIMMVCVSRCRGRRLVLDG